jgi:DNA adenine methylase
MSSFSPLRYPGGKGRLAAYLAEVVELNGLQKGHYVEPFAGGAGVALELLLREKIAHIHINDIDPSIYAFWKSAIYESDEFADRIMSTVVSVDTWLRAKEVKRHPENATSFDLGFATFFLSRTNRSGILNGGIIGGLSQGGVWKIDCRFNKVDLANKIRRIGFFRSRISVSNDDAAHFLMKRVPSIRPRSLIYIDPPYYVKGAYLYENHYHDEDHVRLAEIVLGVKRHSWIVSYDNVPAIRKLYRKYDQQKFDINYSAREYARGQELMIFCDGLVRPNKVYTSKKEYMEMNAHHLRHAYA